MSDSSTSFWKSIAIFLLVLLLGVYLLYEWYDDQLAMQLSEKDALIEQTKQQLTDLESRRQHSEEVKTAIAAEIDQLRQQHETEKRRLEEQIAADVDAQSRLEQRMADLEAAHAEALAAERGKTAEASAEKETLAARAAELESGYEAAQARALALQADLDKVQQAIAQAASEHQAKIDELERHLNERVELSRITPMDETLMRTAQEVGVLPVAADLDEQGQGLQRQLADATSQLQALQSEYAAVKEQLAEAQEQLKQAPPAEDGQGGGGDAGPTNEEMAREHAQQMAAMEKRLSAEAQVRQALQQQHEAAVAALNERLEGAGQALVEAQAQLSQARASSESAAEEGSAQLTDAQARVKALEAELEAVQGEAAMSETALQDQVAALEEALAGAQAEAQRAQEEAGAAPEAVLREATTQIESLQGELEQARQAAEAGQAAKAELERMRALKAGFAELNGTYTDRGLLLRLAENELRFLPGQAGLPAGDLVSLDRIAALLASQPDLSVRIEGHTDSSGQDELNLALSKERAAAVRQALIDRGVAADRLEADGAGSARPIATNATADGRSANRRVEIYLLD